MSGQTTKLLHWDPYVWPLEAVDNDTKYKQTTTGKANPQTIESLQD